MFIDFLYRRINTC